MTVEEVFSQLSAHMIEGVMTHAQLSDYYNFLGLKGYSECHNYHFYCENKSYRAISDYYVKHYQKLIPETQIPNPKLVPQSWVHYTRQSATDEIRKTATKTGFDKWIEWERDTKNMYEEFYKELVNIGDIASACFVKDLIIDVSEELSDAQQLQIELEAIDYDMTVIIEKQDMLYKKFKKENK